MRSLYMLTAAVTVLVTSGLARAGDWIIDLDLGGNYNTPYGGPMDLPGINTDVDVTNFTGFAIIGLEFTILPNDGTVYDPDEFEQIFFHSDPPVDPNDVPPYVPASIINLSTEVVTFSNDSGYGYQTLTYMFPSEPVAPGGLIQARFQIEWPDPVLFDLQITPIIPSPGVLALLGVAGVCGRRRRRH